MRPQFLTADQGQPFNRPFGGQSSDGLDFSADTFHSPSKMVTASVDVQTACLALKRREMMLLLPVI